MAKYTTNDDVTMMFRLPRTTADMIKRTPEVDWNEVVVRAVTTTLRDKHKGKRAPRRGPERPKPHQSDLSPRQN